MATQREQEIQRSFEQALARFANAYPECLGRVRAVNPEADAGGLCQRWIRCRQDELRRMEALRQAAIRDGGGSAASRQWQQAMRNYGAYGRCLLPWGEATAMRADEQGRQPMPEYKAPDWERAYYGGQTARELIGLKPTGTIASVATGPLSVRGGVDVGVVPGGGGPSRPGGEDAFLADEGAPAGGAGFPWWLLLLAAGGLGWWYYSKKGKRR